MDSLPTGSTQSWLIVAAVAFSPAIVLFLADAVGWFIRQAGEEGGVTTVGQAQAGPFNEHCSDWGDGHWCVPLIEPSRGGPDLDQAHRTNLIISRI